eukprot:3053330-Ditylum_brightwellii.AAC.1
MIGWVKALSAMAVDCLCIIKLSPQYMLGNSSGFPVLICSVQQGTERWISFCSPAHGNGSWSNKDKYSDVSANSNVPQEGINVSQELIYHAIATLFSSHSM